MNNQESSVFINDKNIYNKPIVSAAVPEKNIGVDTDQEFYKNLIASMQTSHVDMSTFDSFFTSAQSRDQVYSMIDMMCQDSIIASVLETYSEDVTEYNENGHIIWCESTDPDVQKFVNFLLDEMNIDKNIYLWANSLIKYGDIYLRLFKESDYDDLSLFEDKKSKKQLNEDVKLKIYSKNDHYKHYVEMEPNPAEMFELTKYGKTYAYIKADVSSLANNIPNQQIAQAQTFRYKMNKRDITVYEPTVFVHGCLEDNISREPEEVEIFKDEKSYATGEDGLLYRVKRGKSIFYDIFKIWRQLTLLENSVLLNRVTKSSLVRVIGVEVGDMSKEMVGPHLQGIKSMFEQKEALNANNSMSEYTNPGPIENNIYVPTRNGIGAINTQQVGGDVNPGDLTDIKHFQDKFFGALRVPKQYFGVLDDNAGFSGGESLSIISSRYAKMIKRIQNTLCQTITDIINLILLDKEQDSYINKFTIRITPPVTKEEIDRRENTSGRVQLASDIMNMVSDLETVPKLKILKELMNTFIADSDVISILQEEIDKLENSENGKADSNPSSNEEESVLDNEPLDLNSDIDLDSAINNIGEENPVEDTSSENVEVTSSEEELPSPEDLGIDFTDNNSNL